jgi:hypothetical protein
MRFISDNFHKYLEDKYMNFSSKYPRWKFWRLLSYTLLFGFVLLIPSLPFFVLILVLTMINFLIPLPSEYLNIINGGILGLKLFLCAIMIQILYSVIFIYFFDLGTQGKALDFFRTDFRIDKKQDNNECPKDLNEPK